ncbi:MAG: hypothetical protein ACI9O4_000614 [Chitinophagales bacterium]|jgi:hypothetical protein
MHNSKLTQVLASFSDKEIKELDKYLLYQADSSSNVYQLFEIYKNAYPDFFSKHLVKQQVFKTLFGNGEYKDVKVREQMSALRKLTEGFLIQQELQKVDFYNNLALLKQYRKRNIGNLFQQQEKNIQLLLDGDEYLNIENFKRAFLVADEKNNFFEQQQNITHDDSISLKNENFDKYYFSAKLRTLCEILNREKILNSNYSKHIEDDVLTIIAKHKKLYFDIPAIHCYFEIFNLLKTDNDSSQFTQTLNTLNGYQKSFTDGELKSMYAYLSNYCIQHVNKGNADFTPILFDMQKLLLQNKILLENGLLSHISYRNIVAIAIKLNEYTWAEKFIEDYKASIAESHQENAYNLSKSNLLYAKGEFEETVYLLNQVHFTDVYYACTSKYTLLKAYHALKELDTLDYFVSSFQLFLKRNKEISVTFKKSSENFLKLFKKLLLIQKQLDYKEKEKLEKKVKDLITLVEEERTLANKSWLIEEINKIKL